MGQKRWFLTSFIRRMYPRAHSRNSRVIGNFDSLPCSRSRAELAVAGYFVSRGLRGHRTSARRVFGEWQNFTAKCDRSRGWPQVSGNDSGAVLAVGVMYFAEARRGSKKSDRTGTLETVALKSPEWSKRAFASSCALDSPRRLTSSLGTAEGGGMAGPGGFRLCGSINVYTFLQQSPFLGGVVALHEPSCRAVPRGSFLDLFARHRAGFPRRATDYYKAPRLFPTRHGIRRESIYQRECLIPTRSPNENHGFNVN